MKNLIEKFKNAAPAAKASMAFLFANLVLKGISLVSGPVFTRIMTTEQYGIVSTFFSWESVFSVIITLNLSSGVFNNGMLEYKKDRDVFQFSVLTISTVSTGLFFIIFCFLKDYIIDLLDLPVLLIYSMFLNFLFIPAYSFWSGRQRYEFKYKALTVISILCSLVSIFIGITAVILAPENYDAIARILAFEGVSIGIGIFFYAYIAYKAKLKCKLSYCIYALKFNIPLVPHYLSMYVLASSDRIMITKLIDASATAIYSVAYTVASVITIVWQSIEASLSPWIYEKLSQNDEKAVKKLTTSVLFIFALMCTVCTLFAPEIMAILAPPSYSKGIYVIPSVAAGVFFTALYSLYMRVELYYKQTGFATIATTVAAIANIILNYIFIRIFGFVAAGYTTMVCYALLSLFHYFNVNRKGFASIFNNKFFLIISIVLIVFSLIISILYSYPLLRYCFISILILALFIKRKIILDVFLRK